MYRVAVFVGAHEVRLRFGAGQLRLLRRWIAAGSRPRYRLMSDYTAQRTTPAGEPVPPELDEPMVAAVVSAFYAKARRDELIGPVFNRIIAADRWPEHIQTITDFWSSMLLGTQRYVGRPMPKHVAIPELNDEHFQRWLTLFRETAQELCPPQIAALFVERAERIGYSFRIRIAQLRGQDSMSVKPQRG